MNVYQTVADKGNRKASYKVAQLMSKNAKEKQQAYKALSYAYKALDRVRKSKNKTEEGWPVYKRTSAEQIVKIVTDFKLVPRDKKEYESLERDYATPGGMKRFTVPIDCGQQNKNFPYEVYVWNWRKEYSPVVSQAEWVEKVRGCKFPKDTLDKFNEAAKLANKEFLPLADVTAFKLGGKKTREKARQKLSKILERRKIAAAKYKKRSNPDYYFKTLTNLENYPAVALCKAKTKKLDPLAIPVDKAVQMVSNNFRGLKKLTKQFPKYFPTRSHDLKAFKILEALDDCAENGNKDIFLELSSIGSSILLHNKIVLEKMRKEIENSLNKFSPEFYFKRMISLAKQSDIKRCRKSKPKLRQNKMFNKSVRNITEAFVRAKKLTSDKLSEVLFDKQKMLNLYRKKAILILDVLNNCKPKTAYDITIKLQSYAAQVEAINGVIIKAKLKALKK